MSWHILYGGKGGYVHISLTSEKMSIPVGTEFNIRLHHSKIKENAIRIERNNMQLFSEIYFK